MSSSAGAPVALRRSSSPASGAGRAASPAPIWSRRTCTKPCAPFSARAAWAGRGRSFQGAVMPKRRPPGALWPALLALDAIAVNLAFVLAYYARYELQIGPEVAEANYAPLSDYLPILPALTLLILATYAIFGVYRKTPLAPPIEEFVSVLQASSVGLVLALAGIFLA